MGLIDFVKSAGHKLFGRDEPAATPAARTSAQTQATTDTIKGHALENLVRSNGFSVEGLAISVSGDVATVRGKVASQAEREKVVLVVGNVESIARVDDQLEVAAAQAEAAPEPEATYYTVKKGDTLWAIAKASYGNGNKYQAIFEANQPMLTHPDKIYPGQVLRIPPLG